MRRQAYRGRGPVAFHNDEDGEENEELYNQMRQERMRMMMRDDGDQGAEQEDDLQQILDYEDVNGPLSQWLKKTEVIRFVVRQFGAFLRNYSDDQGQFVYEEKIHEMCMNNKQSLEIVFNHLSQKNPTLAIWLAEEPSMILPMFNQVANELVGEVYPDYHNLFSHIFVRIKDLPVEDKLRDLRQVHLNALIKIRGVVTKRTGVFPELIEMYYRCSKCSDIKGPIFHHSENDPKQFLGQCTFCQSRGPYLLDATKSLYRNYQKWTIQETPGTVPAGRVPR